MTEPDKDDQATDSAERADLQAVRGRRQARRFKRATIVLHRWSALILGLALVVISTSGAAVLYSPEWTWWTNQDVFSVTTSAHPVPVSTAIAAVDQAHPAFQAGSVNVYHGLYEVFSADQEANPGFYGVDPGTGRITGQIFPDRGAMAFMKQIHECFLSCSNYPGYVAFLSKPVPTFGMHWLEAVNWAGLVLGASAILLILLTLSGIWLWWPGVKRWTHGVRLRWRKGRYARDYDLHQVAGMIAVPFLLMWAITGANFEFTWVGEAWYSVTGGQTPPEHTFVSLEAKEKTPDTGLESANAAAQTAAGRQAVLTFASLPAPDDATGTYTFWFSRGFDQYRHSNYPGSLLIDVDRHDAGRMHVDDQTTAPTVSNQLLDNWGAGMFHYGYAVNAGWRLIWFVFGLVPLLLAVTGLSTWLVKRKVRKDRRKQTTTAPGLTDDLQVQAPSGQEDERPEG